ncbi:MAG: hypothetical protein JW963_10710 [Anaerolineales bacterium]|nr:hypothetical protein [Anaerolineales bacterium]
MLTQYHATITRKALSERFSSRALEAIVAANLGQDNLRGQIGHDEYHFDNNAFEKSYAFIEAQRALTVSSLQDGDVPVAWAAFGRLTHTAQDFYAHSNYVDLWLARFTDKTPPSPLEIDPLMDELVNSPELHSGKLYYPLEALSFVPFLKRFVMPLLPRDSHAWMNLDSPERGKRFEYAIEAALKRTRHELDGTVAGLSSGQVALFTARSS